MAQQEPTGGAYDTSVDRIVAGVPPLSEYQIQRVGALLGRRVVDLMRTEEVSQETGIPVATLRYWRHKGTGPRSAKLGRRVVYRRSDVEAWIDEQFETGGDNR